MPFKQETIASRAPVLTKEKGESLALSRKSVATSLVSGKRPQYIVDQWMNIMRSYYEPKKVVCKSTLQQEGHGQKKFPTRANFEGHSNSFGMQGQGVYTFPARGTEVRYEGNFLNGQFHGEGDLIYDSGVVLKCKWNHGELVERKLYFADGLERLDVEDWLYNKYPDRRYAVEYDYGVKPAGESYITCDKVPKPIPPGYYDVGYGFFQAETGAIYRYDDLTRIVSYVSARDQQWIVANCRTNPMKSLGPCPFFYEEWQPPLDEAEYPPPPAALTTTYRERAESLYDDEDEQNWNKFRFSRQSRASRFAPTAAARQSAF